MKMTSGVKHPKMSSMYVAGVVLSVLVIIGLIVFLAVYFSNNSSGSNNPVVIPTVKTVSGTILGSMPGSAGIPLMLNVPNKLATFWLNMSAVAGTLPASLTVTPKPDLTVTAKMTSTLGTTTVELYKGSDYILDTLSGGISLPDSTKTNMAIRLNSMALVYAPNPSDTYSMSLAVEYLSKIPGAQQSIVPLAVNLSYNYTYF